MIQTSQFDQKIIQELIRNPRISDNKISKKTSIPVMTVNRRRKALEEAGVLTYYTSVKKHADGLGTFNARQLYTIKLRAGITRKNYINTVERDPKLKAFNSKYVSTTLLGEKNGHLALVLILDAKNDRGLMDEFNGKIILILKEKFGEDAVKEIDTVRINDSIRLHHNYLPLLNMEKGIIKDEWPNEFIFAGFKNE